MTGERRHLALARRFCHRAILDPLLRREDRLAAALLTPYLAWSGFATALNAAIGARNAQT